MVKKIILSLLLLTLTLYPKDYSQDPNVQRFINEMVVQYKCDRSKLTNIFSKAKFSRQALSVYVKALRPIVPPKKNVPKSYKGPWDQYESWLLKETRVNKGVEYIQRHSRAFELAHKRYGVAPEYIAAIIGIESYYGKNTGKYNVLDTLTTLSFESNRRQNFFRKELKEYLLMAKREGFNPASKKGSIAGALGLGQFIPSTYRHFAVDFDRNGKRELDDHTDAIGSIASYFKRHGWRGNEAVATRVKYDGTRYNGTQVGFKHKHSRANLSGMEPKDTFNYSGPVHLIKLKRYSYDELWYGAKNFYVITRYNHSDYYAMAVHQLAQKIKARYDKEKSGGFGIFGF